MKKLIIDSKHENEINQVLKESQGKSKVRLIKDYAELRGIIDRSKERFGDVPKIAYQDCLLHLRIGAWQYPATYDHSAIGTCATIRFRKDGNGELIKICRGSVKGGKEEKWEITEAMRDYIVASLGCVMQEQNKESIEDM